MSIFLGNNEISLPGIASVSLGNQEIWNSTPPSPSVLPVKGQLITFKMGNPYYQGINNTYRVLNINNTTAEVMAMYLPSGMVLWNPYAEDPTYADKTLDIYLNNTLYNSLNTTAKNAIVQKNIIQYAYTSSTSVKTDTHMSIANYSTKTVKQNVGNRYLYALDVEDIEMYFGGTGGSVSAKTPGTFSNIDLFQFLYNSSSKPAHWWDMWLRSFDSGNQYKVYSFYAATPYIEINNTYSSNKHPLFAFTIDLSKINWQYYGGAE